MEWKMNGGNISCTPLSMFATIKLRDGNVLVAMDLVPSEQALLSGDLQRVQVGMTAAQAIEVGRALIDAGTRQFREQNIGAKQ